MEEKLLETGICSISGDIIDIMVRDIQFYDMLSPTINGKKYSLPKPTITSQQRQQRRLAHGNLNKLYKRSCDLTGKPIMSLYAPGTPYKVYNIEDWGSDKWDAGDYGMEIDMNNSFFDQFYKLSCTVPVPSTIILNSKKCLYCNAASNNTNCYYSFRVHECNDVLYSYRTNDCKHCIDCYQITDCEYMYESVHTRHSSKCTFVHKCNHVKNSEFLRNCNNCDHCFMCFDLDNASYCIENKRFSPEEYFIKIKKMKEASYESLLNTFKKHIDTNIFPSFNNENTTNSTGDFLIDCDDCFSCYMMQSSNACRYIRDSIEFSNSMDVFSGKHSTYVYEGVSIKHSEQIICSMRISNCKRCYYSKLLSDCKDCFGCIGLKNKQYCIFNKQYKKEEYYKAVSQIILKMKEDNEWGNFFPIPISPFPYNDSLAQEFFPLQKAEAIKLGYSRSEQSTIIDMLSSDKDVININDIPEDIVKIDSSILDKTLLCKKSGRPYTINLSELLFYCKFGLPIPKYHPDVRFKRKRSLFCYKTNIELIPCEKCQTTIKSSVYRPGNSPKIYCADCYKKYRIQLESENIDNTI